jgi:hypothetical protein
MYGSQVVQIIQILSVMLCTAVAFGLLLSTMLVRGRLHSLGAEGPLHDVAFTERAHVAAAMFCAVGAIASVNLSWGTFAMFLGVAASLHLMDQALVPAMRRAAEAGAPVPHAGARARVEIVASACLFLIFWKTAVPPLVTLAMTYGIG